MKISVVILLCLLTQNHGPTWPDAWIQENGARCICPDIEYWKKEKELVVKLDHLDLDRIIIQIDGLGGERHIFEIVNPKEYVLEKGEKK